MEIVRSHRQIAAEAAAGVGCGGGAGGLPTYRVAPQLEVRLEEFELFAIDRLRGAGASSPLPTVAAFVESFFPFLPRIL
jgi:hypothetical protein